MNLSFDLISKQNHKKKKVIRERRSHGTSLFAPMFANYEIDIPQILASRPVRDQSRHVRIYEGGK